MVVSHGRRWGAWLRRGAVLLGLAWCLSAAARAPAEPYTLRIVGGLATLNQYTRQEEPFWTRELPRLSQGRYRAEIVPFDRAGVPGGEMLSLLQLGVVPFGTVLMSSFTADYPEYTAADLAGLNPDVATMRSTLAAFRPHLEKSLRERLNVQVLAVYTYPAQVVFCKRPMGTLADLNGRRVRVSSSTQADFVSALGGIPVVTSFAQMMLNMQSGSTECAITGTMSGNTLGLHALTSHLHSLPITWGLAIFGAHLPTWQALPADLRELLQRELPRLERAVWAESERETAEGIACNQGLASCTSGRKGGMVVVPVSRQDDINRREILETYVLPRWVQRCGNACVPLWNQTIGPVRGLTARPAR